MSKVSTRKQNRSPRRAKSTPPIPTRNPRRKPATAGKKDGATLSKESGQKTPENGRAGGIISSIQNWWNGSSSTAEAGKTDKAKTDDAAKAGAAEGPKPMTLDKGQLLRKGASGDKVTQLQELLNSKGAKLDVDGKFGPKTLSALREFQGANELSTDGVLGPKTLEKLNGAQEQGATNGADKTGKTDQTGNTQAPGQESNAAGNANGRFANTRESLNKLPKPLQKYADTFQKAGEKYGVDPRFLAAISMHETGNGTSSAFRNKRNAMGISNRRGPVRMSSVEASIDKMARTLAKPNGYYKGRTTIGAIGKVYAPVGAANDPTGLNGYWAKGVAKNYKRFGGSPTGQVIFR